MSKILVIDDDPSYGDMLAYQFRSLGHETQLTRSLREGRDSLVTFQPDVIYLDVGLPDGSGLSVIGELKDTPGCPEVIIVTGRGSADGAELAIRNGAWNYVCKGGSNQEIVLSLQQVLEYRRGKQEASPRALDLGGIVGSSRAMQRCFDLVAHAAGTDVNVLVTGETGTGKEMMALAIHRNSRRAGKGYVVVDCAALPETLVESVLFGHKKGAFTGATENRIGLLELAHHGTLLLDEVGEMPMSVQKAFLRALQERRFRPVGSDREVESDFRLIAATNRDLDDSVAQGHFRQDLLFRLRAIEIRLPSLRDREDDVRQIAHRTVARICEREHVGTKGISPEFYDTLARYKWPGNVRELLNALEYAVVRAHAQEMLYAVHLPTEIRASAARRVVEPDSMPPQPMPEQELGSLQEYQDAAAQRYLVRLMAIADGDVRQACSLSGFSRSHLYALLKRHQVDRLTSPPSEPGILARRS